MLRSASACCALIAAIVAALFSPATASAAVRAGWSWTHLAEATSPSPRFWESLAYDPTDQGVILFGGENDSPRPTDTWLWRPSGWVQLHPPASPPGRDLAAMAYDPATAQLVLFSGEGCTGYCNDTWIWSDGTWTEAHPANSPSPRDGAVMAYDPHTRQLVMFGGNTPACGVNTSGCADTWVWDGANWSLVDTNGPRVGEGAGVAYDVWTRELVLYGGNNVHDTSTWGWTGSRWLLLNTSGPCGASEGAMAVDIFGEPVWFEGLGCYPEGTPQRTFAWTGSKWTPLRTGTVSPDYRWGSALAFDPPARRDVLFGGNSILEGDVGDTWTLSWSWHA